jgi:hypothetical protein
MFLGRHFDDTHTQPFPKGRYFVSIFHRCIFRKSDETRSTLEQRGIGVIHAGLFGTSDGVGTDEILNYSLFRGLANFGFCATDVGQETVFGQDRTNLAKDFREMDYGRAKHG